MSKDNCFGFYAGDQGPCGLCIAAKRCKAVLVSNGFDILSNTINQLVTELPDINYKDTDRIPELLSQLLEPVPAKLTAEEEELLGVLKTENTDEISYEAL